MHRGCYVGRTYHDLPMTHHGRVKLSDVSVARVAVLLAPVNPTAKRLDGLLQELQEWRSTYPEGTMLDEQDRELGRRVHRPALHAEMLNQGENLEIALANLSEAEANQRLRGAERLREAIAANEARGLHQNAPAIEEEPPVEEHPTAESREPDAGTPPPVAPPAAPQPQDEAAKIEDAKRAGFTRVRQVSEGLERKVLQKMPDLRSAGRTLKSLEDAAEVLIAELDPGDQDAIRQVMDEHGLANWVVVLGAVKRMADLQELNAGEFSEAWQSRQARGGTPASAKEEICQMCGGKLTPDPIRKGRTACCNKHGSGFVEHTEGCSLAHLKMVKGAWVTVQPQA